eukprot:355993-Chlamydomonas_euryale.AAC.16
MLPDGEESESCVCQYCLQEIDFEASETRASLRLAMRPQSAPVSSPLILTLPLEMQRDYSTELSCGRAGCGRSPFHQVRFRDDGVEILATLGRAPSDTQPRPVLPPQTCIETHLRKLKLPTDRMAGFPCPRGHGKDRTDDSIPCKGRIDSTHKRLPCNLKKKKKALAPVPAPARNGRKDGVSSRRTRSSDGQVTCAAACGGSYDKASPPSHARLRRGRTFPAGGPVTGHAQRLAPLSLPASPLIPFLTPL